MDISKLNTIKNNYIFHYEKSKIKLDEYQQKLAKAITEDNYREMEIYTRRINNLIDRMRNYQTHIEFMRPNIEEDLQERLEIFQTFPQIIKSIIPDQIPLVFHGNNNIGIVLEIIKSGGLFTPEQRGVSETSFATQIDVTAKSNIKVSCEFAEPGMESFMPYGAIFVFLPLESEIEKVLNTGENTEVFGGVEGVNFKEQPDRLIGIITTTENKSRIQNCCLEYDWPHDKVFTHQEFLLQCNKLYAEDTHRSK